jgi:hypothetical protein
MRRENQKAKQLNNKTAALATKSETNEQRKSTDT